MVVSASSGVATDDTVDSEVDCESASSPPTLDAASSFVTLNSVRVIRKRCRGDSELWMSRSGEAARERTREETCPDEGIGDTERASIARERKSWPCFCKIAASDR